MPSGIPKVIMPKLPPVNKHGRKGGKPGRPKGSVNRFTMYSDKMMVEILRGKKTPLEFFLTLLGADGVPTALRIEAAKAAAPYVHKKQPTALELTGNVDVNHRGGVMVVPAPQSNEEWEKRTAEAQASLKEEVKQ